MQNPLNTRPNTQNGNAMIYILIALALFGFLTMTMTRQANQSDGQNLDNEQIALYADQLMGYVSTLQLAVDMMIDTGSSINDLDFITPADPAFDTAPHIHKVFHPQGGGVNHQESYAEDIKMSTGSGWKVNTITNVEWTPTSANDVILSAYQLPASVCSYLNKKITGDETIPSLAVGALSTLFDPDASPEDFDIADCADCEGRSNLCVVESGATDHGFYSLIAVQ